MARHIIVITALVIAALAAACEKADNPSTNAAAQVLELRALGRHAEADDIARRHDLPVDEEHKFGGLPSSYKEVFDTGDDPLTGGCVCCYDDAQCSIIRARSVDECFPGGVGGDDLRENIAPTVCTAGRACAQRKSYKCSKLAPGSVCKVVPVDCCGVATTTAFCKFEL